MRKILTRILIFVTSALLLCACGNNENGNTENTETTELIQEGITINGAVGSASSIKISNVTDGEIYNTVTTNLETTGTLEVYDITLLNNDNVAIQPDGSVEITLALSESLLNADGDEYHVYRLENDSTLTKLNSTVTENEITFITDHFSIYVIEKVISEPIDNTTEEVETEVEEESESDTESDVEEEEQEPVSYTYTDMNKTMYVVSSVNVRNLPSTEGTKVGSLSKGTQVLVTGQCNETGWYRFEFDGSSAYVSNSYLSENEPAPDVPADNGGDSGNGGGVSSPGQLSEGQSYTDEEGYTYYNYNGHILQFSPNVEADAAELARQIAYADYYQIVVVGNCAAMKIPDGNNTVDVFNQGVVLNDYITSLGYTQTHGGGEKFDTNTSAHYLRVWFQ